MEMRASQVIKGTLGGGAKKKEEKNQGGEGETERGKKRREEKDTFKSNVEVWKQECHRYFVAVLTSLIAKVSVAFVGYSTGLYLETIMTHFR